MGSNFIELCRTTPRIQGGQTYEMWMGGDHCPSCGKLGRERAGAEFSGQNICHGCNVIWQPGVIYYLVRRIIPESQVENPSSSETWALSLDGVTALPEPCLFQSRADAEKVGRQAYKGICLRFYVGAFSKPASPEEFFNCQDWLEHVSCQDDYSGDHAEGWNQSTPAMREELTTKVRAVMLTWLTKHNLIPTFSNIEWHAVELGPLEHTLWKDLRVGDVARPGDRILEGTMWHPILEEFTVGPDTLPVQRPMPTSV